MSLGNTIWSCSRGVKNEGKFCLEFPQKDKYKNYEFISLIVFSFTRINHTKHRHKTRFLSHSVRQNAFFLKSETTRRESDTNNTAERAQRKWQKENGGEMMNLPPLNPLRRLRRAKKREDLRPPRIRPPPPPLPKKEDDERRRRRRRETTTT